MNAKPFLGAVVGVTLAIAVGCSGDNKSDQPSGTASDGGPGNGGNPGGGNPGGGNDGGNGGGASDGGGGGDVDGSVVGPDGGSLCAAADATSTATIGGYLDKLPYGNPTGTLRSQIIDAIFKSCEMFGPPNTAGAWKTEYCWAHLVSNIEKESSYNAMSVVTDSYATRMIGASKANDPTVGLLQLRFSSTVRDFTISGPKDRLACIGCTLPASFAQHVGDPGDSDFWAVSGPTQNLSLMESPACNIGMSSWYFYVNASGNGNASTTTYVDGYCSGQGTAANMITGFRSFLDGPSGGRGVIADMNGVNALMSTDDNAYKYITAIKGWFDTMVTASGTHPFFIMLSPNPPQYCGK